MKKLQDKPNTLAVSVTWPYGGMIDETGSNNGSRANREFMNDYVQTFEKIFAESGLTANGELDNATNGFQMYNAVRKLLRPYRVYTALLTQSGTSAPTVTVLGMNDVGTIVWARAATGQYTGTLTGVFVDSKTTYTITTGVNGGIERFVRRISDSVIQVDTYIGGSSADSAMSFTPIEIRVYDLILV